MDELLNKIEANTDNLVRTICKWSLKSSEDEFMADMGGRAVQESLSMVGAYRMQSWIGVFHATRGLLEAFAGFTYYVYTEGTAEREKILKKWSRFRTVKELCHWRVVLDEINARLSDEQCLDSWGVTSANVRDSVTRLASQQDELLELFEKQKLEHVNFWHSPLSVRKLFETVEKLWMAKHPESKIDGLRSTYYMISNFTHPTSFVRNYFYGENWPATITARAMDQVKTCADTSETLQRAMLSVIKDVRR